jgi:hypothetical protein
MINKNADKDIFKIESDKIKDNNKTGTEINIVYDFYDDLVYSKPCVIKFAYIKRFFCSN